MSVYARLCGTFSAWMATGHPRFPREGLAARYADHPDGIYRQLAVRDPAAGPDLIERLSHDPDVGTRQAATRDPRLPLPWLLAALSLPEPASSAGVPTRPSPRWDGRRHGRGRGARMTTGARSGATDLRLRQHGHRTGR